MQTVKDRVGYKSNASIYAKMNQGTFPRPIKINDGSDSNRWLESDIDEWIEDQITAFRGGYTNPTNTNWGDR